MTIKALKHKENGVILPWNEILAQDPRMEEVEVEEQKPQQEAAVEPLVVSLPGGDPTQPGADDSRTPARDAAASIGASPASKPPGLPTGPATDDEEDLWEDTPPVRAPAKQPLAKGRR